MADNVAITAGSGTSIAADDISGVFYQRVKVTWGPDGTANDADVATGKPLPVQVRSSTGLIPIGEPTDAKNTATDTTSVSIVSILKQLSAYLGAALAVSQSGTWTVQPGNTANTTAWKVDGSAVTQPVSGTVSLTDISNAEYETVAASQTDQALGATGASGDYLAGVLIVPATTSPGAVSIKDGSGSAITIFTGGTSSVSNLVPFMVALGIKSTGGAWKVTTGTNVSCIGVGNFT